MRADRLRDHELAFERARRAAAFRRWNAANVARAQAAADLKQIDERLSRLGAAPAGAKGAD